MLPALLAAGLLILKPRVATIHEGAPDTESFWRRPGVGVPRMLYWTSPERTPYTYDTLEHYYY